MNIFLGIELEAVFENAVLNLQNDGYHSQAYGRQISGWAVTQDSSIKVGSSKFIQPACLELVSEKINSSEWKKYLTMLKKHCEGKVKGISGIELEQLMTFNSSCGAHIHFSTDSCLEFNLITMKWYKELRERTMDRVRLEVPEVYREFKNQYYRSHAKEQSGEFINKKLRGEINYTALNKGVEWRSFNLRGVKTWDNLFKMIKIAVEEIERILINCNDTNCEEEYNTIIDQNEIEKYKEMISLCTKEV